MKKKRFFEARIFIFLMIAFFSLHCDADDLLEEKKAAMIEARQKLGTFDYNALYHKNPKMADEKLKALKDNFNNAQMDYLNYYRNYDKALNELKSAYTEAHNNLFSFNYQAEMKKNNEVAQAKLKTLQKNYSKAAIAYNNYVAQNNQARSAQLKEEKISRRKELAEKNRKKYGALDQSIKPAPPSKQSEDTVTIVDLFKAGLVIGAFIDIVNSNKSNNIVINRTDQCSNQAVKQILRCSVMPGDCDATSCNVDADCGESLLSNSSCEYKLNFWKEDFGIWYCDSKNSNNINRDINVVIDKICK